MSTGAVFASFDGKAELFREAMGEDYADPLALILAIRTALEPEAADNLLAAAAGVHALLVAGRG